ncbi:MAG: glycosyltransferase [Planctomycetes bacterium]|nr:glycosyltransferase [Planctomycetota bacterium]
MRRRAFVTVATRNYSHFAFALAESAQRHHPEADFFICFADPPDLSTVPTCLNIKSFLASELAIKEWRRFVFQYTPFELSCALKPFAMKYLCDFGYEEILYLDADVRVLSSLSEVFLALTTDSILLTPHLIKPYPDDGGRPGEDAFLMSGIFNAGFLAIRKDDVSGEFLAWWMRRLQSECFIDFSNGINADQKWLSLVPGLFDRVRVLRDPTINTGHWTLPQYSLSFDACGRACIDQRPIALFHFSGLSPNSPLQFDHDQTRTSLKKEPVLRALVSEYHAAIQRYNSINFQSLGCEYDCLSDGTMIRPEWREAIRRQHPLFANLDDPFDVGSVQGLVKKYTSIEADARKWRKDWRLKGASNSREVKKLKQIERRIKSVLYALGLRKKAA